VHWANKYKLPEHMVEAIVKQTYDLSQSDQSIISVTTLTSPPRIRQLMIRHWDEIKIDVSDSLWLLLGGAMHEVMQRISGKNRLIEERLKEPIMGITIAGKPDLFEEPHINDYKCTSVWAVKFEKEEWVSQLNCYAWFLRKMGFKVKDAFINAILRDWNRRASLITKDYPPIPFKIINVPIWSFEKQDDYVHDRIAIHLNAATEEDKNLPLCTEKERWKNNIRCQSYCSVAPFCDFWKENYEKNKKI
jgi:hypothetical protein